MPSSDTAIERKEEMKPDEKKKNQAEIEQEMAALQYTNPQLLEVCLFLKSSNPVSFLFEWAQCEYECANDKNLVAFSWPYVY